MQHYSMHWSAGLDNRRLTCWLLLIVYGAQARLWLTSLSRPLDRDCSDSALFTPQRCCRSLQRLQIDVSDLRAAAQDPERTARLAELYAGKPVAPEFGSMEPRLQAHLGPIEGLWHWPPTVHALFTLWETNQRGTRASWARCICPT